MRNRRLRAGMIIIMVFSSFLAIADEGTLSGNQRIHSAHLGYDLQYRVYRPSSISVDNKLSSLYVTDGQRYLAQGNFKSVLDRAINEGIIQPVLVVFLDSRNPDKLNEDRRHSQFMCNADFAAFFAAEFIPTISRRYPVSPSRDDRVSMGVSFGGLNSACFGLMLSKWFSGIAMQSPASGKHVAVVQGLYEKKETLPLRLFLSVGTRHDNTAAVKSFRETLEDKGYDLTFIKVHGGHDWENWGPLLDDVLLTFFATAK